MPRSDDKHAFARGPIGEDCGLPYGEQNGLTKRELFAAMAMQGMLSNEKLLGTWSEVATVKFAAVDLAVSYADALLEELK